MRIERTYASYQIGIYEMTSTPALCFIRQDFGDILTEVLVIFLCELGPTVFVSNNR